MIESKQDQNSKTVYIAPVSLLEQGSEPGEYKQSARENEPGADRFNLPSQRIPVESVNPPY